MGTLLEWVNILKDLDAYISRGGQLLDIEMISLDQVPDAVRKLVTDEIGEQQIERLSRFNHAIASAVAAVSDTARVEDILTEDALRVIWRESADDMEKLGEKIKNSVTRRVV